MDVHYTSFFLPLGWGVTALQGKPLHLKALLSSWGVVGEDVLVSTCGLGEGRLALLEMDQ